MQFHTLDWCYTAYKMDWEIMSNGSKIGMKQCSITQMYVLNDVMNKCFKYYSILLPLALKILFYNQFCKRKPQPKFFEHHVFNTHMKSNMAQRLLLFPINKHKKCEMQKHNDSDNISVECRYCNQAPKSQFIEISTSASITIRPQNSNW